MQDLQTKPNIGEMFNIQEKEDGEIAISGRELHQALEAVSYTHLRAHET